MTTSGKPTEIIAPRVEKRELAPPGLNPATLIEIVDSGMMTFGDKTRHMITLVWATDALDSHGEPFRVYDRVHLTVHHKGHLASRIEAVTGALPPEDEPYPVHTLLGGRALLQVKHRKTEKGIYANVVACFPISSSASKAATTAPPKAVENTSAASKPIAGPSPEPQKRAEAVPEQPDSGEWDPSQYDEATNFPSSDAAHDPHAA